MFARSFRDLEVYRCARELAREAFAASKNFPKEESYSLTDQLRRSTRSIGAQIAEAWGKRRYEAHFISKLTDSEAEELESEHWIETAHDCKYLTRSVRDSLLVRCGIIGRMLRSMITKAPQFFKRH